MTIGIRDTRKIEAVHGLTGTTSASQGRFEDSIGIFPEFIDGYGIPDPAHDGSLLPGSVPLARSEAAWRTSSSPGGAHRRRQGLATPRRGT